MLNRIELRSEQAGAIQNPQPQLTPAARPATTDVWLRLTKTGTTYKGEYSFDGTTWTALSADGRRTRMADADVRPLHARRAAAAAATVDFDYFKVDGTDAAAASRAPNNQRR